MQNNFKYVKLNKKLHIVSVTNKFRVNKSNPEPSMFLKIEQFLLLLFYVKYESHTTKTIINSILKKKKFN